MRANIGIYNLGMQSKGGGEKLTLVLAEHLSRDHNVSIFSSGPLDMASLERYFAVDLSRVKNFPLKSPGLLMQTLAKVRGQRSPNSPLHHFLQLRKLNLDLFINNTYGSSLACPARQGVYMCMFPYQHECDPNFERQSRKFPGALIDWADRAITGLAPRDVIASYSFVISISRYTEEWVEKLWGRASEILHPPCDDMGPPALKEKMLLHVGRFQADDGLKGLHHKRQDTLLKAFIEMTRLHKEGWHLHFVGSIEPREASARFAADLVEKARGFPVTFHFDADFDRLRDLYRRTAIYWHATGYGYAAGEYPARQEHFGMSTIEAMSAGAVPIVINSGGQKEIVTHEVDGLKWDDLPNLEKETVRLVADSSLRQRLSRQAIISSARFRREIFATSVDRLIAPLLSSSPAQ
jgi:glycosyltransferase involved in cell wall biosynthesis